MTPSSEKKVLFSSSVCGWVEKRYPTKGQVNWKSIALAAILLCSTGCVASSTSQSTAKKWNLLWRTYKENSTFYATVQLFNFSDKFLRVIGTNRRSRWGEQQQQQHGQQDRERMHGSAIKIHRLNDEDSVFCCFQCTTEIWYVCLAKLMTIRGSGLIKLCSNSCT